MAQKNPADVVILVVAISILLLTSVFVMDTAIQGTGRDDQSSVENESFVADYDNYVSLNNSYIVQGSEVVYASDGSIMGEGSDYDINYEEGSIRALSSGGITDAENCTVGYEYNHKSEALLGVIDLFTTVTSLLGFIPLVLGALILLMVISDMGGRS